MDNMLLNIDMYCSFHLFDLYLIRMLWTSLWRLKWQHNLCSENQQHEEETDEEKVQKERHAVTWKTAHSLELLHQTLGFKIVQWVMSVLSGLLWMVQSRWSCPHRRFLWLSSAWTPVNTVPRATGCSSTSTTHGQRCLTGRTAMVVIAAK